MAMPRGSGKTTLACNVPGSLDNLDLDLPMPVLRSQLPDEAGIRIVADVEAWARPRDTLRVRRWADSRHREPRSPACRDPLVWRSLL
jgi:hypothetical protein